MVKSIIKIAAILIFGILVYNYFLGSQQEKESSHKIFEQVKDLGTSIGDLIKSEKEKFDKGKYDDALDKINDVFKDLKQKASEMDGSYVEEIKELEGRSSDLREKLKNTESDMQDSADTREIKKELNNLIRKTEEILQDMESQ